jgi:hypothetical protein
LRNGEVPECIKHELERRCHKLSENHWSEKRGWIHPHYYLIIDRDKEKLYSVRKRKSGPRRILKLFGKPEYELKVCLQEFWKAKKYQCG